MQAFEGDVNRSRRETTCLSSLLDSAILVMLQATVSNILGVAIILPVAPAAPG